jgi:N-acetylglucosaminyldiphosphoundecaprenol N-acetyl-beta-D-mannosaminyltransferase
MSVPHRHILGMRVDSGNYESSSDLICHWAKQGEHRYVCVSNVHMTMETVDSEAFRNVVNSADLVTSDGMPLVWMLRRLGLPDSERVYGPELVLHVCKRAERERIPIGLFGGTEESLERFTLFLGQHYPDLQVAYRYAPPFRPLTPEEDEAMVEEVAQSGARILFVGIGCPKQERFMHAHKDRIQAVQIGVGAAFDFHSGAVKQAPAWMGRSGLEWLFRLAMEPKRLWRRYAIHNPRFMIRAAWQLLTRSRTVSASAAAVLFLLAGMLMTGFMASKREYSEVHARFDTIHVDQHHTAASDTNPGTSDRPFATISAALSSGLVGPGDTVLVAGGVYREELNPQIGGSGPGARLVIKARHQEEVIISGADPIGTPEPGTGTTWVVNNYEPLDYYGDGHLYQRELVIADGQALKPVFSAADLVEGSFFVDRSSPSTGRILIDTGKPSVPSLEVARRGALFFPGNSWEECGHSGQPSSFHLIGLTFRHAANAAQFGAVCVGGSESLLENVTVEWTVGTGIKVVGEKHRLWHVRSNNNGQTGINGQCIACTIIDSETSFNNFVGHDAFWEAGGGKWSQSAHVQFLRHTAIGNEGPGLWFDGDNVAMTVSYSLFEDNLAAGVFIELNSWDVTVERVTITGTRRLGWTGAGILIQATGGTTLRSNFLSGNEGAGIWLRRDERAESGYNTIEQNVFESNVLDPGQDRADLQIDAQTHLELCSNQVSGNELGVGARFRYSVDENGDVFEGSDFEHFNCLVNYSDF